MSGLVTFTFDPGGGGESAVQLNGPQGETQVGHFPQFVSSRTVDGTRFAYQMHDNVINEWELDFGAISVAQKTAFDLWWRDTIKGPTEVFQYTHTDGSIHSSCRMIEGSLQWGRIDNATWTLNLRFEKPAEIGT